MKKIVKVFLIIFSLVILTGCGKNYDKLSYTEYSEYFNSKHEYVVLDKSSSYGITTTRYLEAGNGNVQVFYIEYAKTDDAIKYVNDLYKDKKHYKLKTKNNYSYVKSTKDKYFKLYRVDNVIVNAVADKKYKKDVNKVLKDLGY